MRILFTLLCGCGAVFASTPVVAAPALLSDAQRSQFSSVAHIAANTYAVPTMVDVRVPLPAYDRRIIAVVDETGTLLPSELRTQVQTQRAAMTVTTVPAVPNAHNMTDGSYTSYAEFPFSEGSDSTVSEHHATIDIVLQRPITTDTLRHIQHCTHADSCDGSASRRHGIYSSAVAHAGACACAFCARNGGTFPH